MVRKERDSLGERELPKECLYGIHTARALENFPLSGRKVHPQLIRAYGRVKLACVQTNAAIGKWKDQRVCDALQAACYEMAEGKLDADIVVDALQGGAGTSMNMNVNEVIANRALETLGLQRGSYETISPLEDVNLHQSTNDTYPTALKLACLELLEKLEEELVGLQEAFQLKEREFSDVVKVGRTELQDAVLITLGREMGAYAEAVARDRWRVFKCSERLRVVNLGGTAVGTGLGAPREYIFEVVEKLRQVSGMKLARAENLVDCTQNADVFVEVSGILKAVAASLLKCTNDLRLLSSGPEAGFGEISLPSRQAGSSIMPGKVNPVIPEAVGQAAISVMAGDQAIAMAASMGNLELNQFMPLIADVLLTNLTLLVNACRMLNELCVRGIAANRENCRKSVEVSTASITCLVEELGYDRAAKIAEEARRSGMTIKSVVVGKGVMSEERFEWLTGPEAAMRLGSRSVTTTNK